MCRRLQCTSRVYRESVDKLWTRVMNVRNSTTISGCHLCSGALGSLFTRISMSGLAKRIRGRSSFTKCL